MSCPKNKNEQLSDSNITCAYVSHNFSNSVCENNDKTDCMVPSELSKSGSEYSNLEYRYTDILVKMILVPGRQSSQDWTITKRTMCFQRAASRWTFGTSREPVQSAPSPGAWTASAASASTLWRSVWLPSQAFESADFESACVPVYLLDQLLQQTELLASCASDRSVILYDMRESTPLKKVGHC